MLRKLVANLRALARDERGPTAVEYGLMLALVAGVIIIAARLIGTNTRDSFNNVAAQMPGP